MDSEYREVIGSQPTRPSEIDTSTSMSHVFERKDIQKYEVKDEKQNVIFTGWKYLEKKTPIEKWQLQTAAQNKENLDAIMLGLTDLYEISLEV